MTERLDDMTMAVFAKDLATMLAAGITPAEGLDILAADRGKDGRQPAWQGLARAVAAGTPLAQGLSESRLFDAYFCDMAALGTEAGRQEETLFKLADFYQRRAETKKLLHDMLIRPLILFAVLAVIMIFLIFAVLPVFTNVYLKLGGYVSGYVTVSYVLAGLAMVAIVVMIAAMLVAAFGQDSPACRSAIRRYWYGSRLTRQAAAALDRATMMGMVDTMIAGGLEPGKALERCQAVLKDNIAASGLAKCAADVARGGNMGLAMDANGLVSPLYAHIIYTGSRNGRTEQAVAQVSRSLFDDAYDAVDGIITTAEPMITGIFTLVIGLTLLSIMLPLVAVITAIG